MTRLRTWQSEWRRGAWYLFLLTMGLWIGFWFDAVYNINITTPTQTTPIVNYDKQIKVLADKIDEQGQLIGAYEFRYRGLHTLPD